jgi:endonuclease/exonuclease/phosphatase (EEP) superfamily protein YafD
MSDRFLEYVAEYDPDIVLAVETDRWWVDQLSVLSAEYPYTVNVPLPNTYGMVLLSRIELVDPEVKYLVADSIPSIHTRARLDDDIEVSLYCVHPRPPFPTEDTDTKQRDAELLIVGREVRRRDEATIVMGDLNDVAWSYTTSLFQRISGLLDPRIGRGMYSTFHSKNPMMRWPLDHIFHSDHFELVQLARLPHFGSDHFPMFAALQYSEKATLEQEKPESGPEDEKAADKKIDEGNNAD